MYTGCSSTMGCFACFPITVLVLTGACSSRGGGFNCAPRIRMSSQPGMGIRVPMAAMMLLPLTAISWISSMKRLSVLTLAYSGS